MTADALRQALSDEVLKAAVAVGKRQHVARSDADSTTFITGIEAMRQVLLAALAATEPALVTDSPDFSLHQAERFAAERDAALDEVQRLREASGTPEPVTALTVETVAGYHALASLEPIQKVDEVVIELCDSHEHQRAELSRLSSALAEARQVLDPLGAVMPEMASVADLARSLWATANAYEAVVASRDAEIARLKGERP